MAGLSLKRPRNVEGRVCPLTAGSTWRAGFSSRRSRQHVRRSPSPAGRSCTRACSSSDQLRQFFRGSAGVPTIRAGHRAWSIPAFQHQYRAHLAAGPSQPPDRPQRRDQHDPGQCRTRCGLQRGDHAGRRALVTTAAQGAAGRSITGLPTRPCWIILWNFWP